MTDAIPIRRRRRPSDRRVDLVDAFRCRAASGGLIEAGAEAIVLTASGCGAFVQEYGDLLRSDPVYAEKAQRMSALARDLAEVVAAEPLDALAGSRRAKPRDRI
ncbi:glycolate oxidase [Burkholderia metallica]|nr:glycolate oxidase [Burkholderia metallica]